jgi:lysophospholipase L1-like esterase
MRFVAWAVLAWGLSATSSWGADAAANVHFRGSLKNSRLQFTQQKRGHVAFIGGSITEMNGYRPLVCESLRKRFPETEFTFTDAGISSTCSTTGAFRLDADVLSKGPVDLFFVEFAVNDDQDAGHARRECLRGMEGIVRHALAHNPNADIVITHFANERMLKTLQEGQTPLTSGCHEEVAERYQVSTINLAKEVAERITAGTLTWEKYGGVHPAPFGNVICAALIDQLFDRAWKAPLAAGEKKTPHPLPEKPLDPQSYSRGKFVDPALATVVSGWKLEIPDWSKLPGQSRDRFKKLPMLCATEPGAELTLSFRGTAIGVFIVAGPDAGRVEASIDGGAYRPYDLFHNYSRGLHYPRTVVFDADLAPGPHTLKLRMTAQKNAASAGTALRIMQFVAND